VIHEERRRKRSGGWSLAHPFFLSPYFQQEILQTGFSAYATDPTPTIFLEHLNT
jgi:hypothetical protein